MVEMSSSFEEIVRRYELKHLMVVSFGKCVTNTQLSATSQGTTRPFGKAVDEQSIWKAGRAMSRSLAWIPTVIL